MGIKGTSDTNPDMASVLSSSQDKLHQDSLLLLSHTRHDNSGAIVGPAWVGGG